jgi:HEAT repeat protein
LGDAEALPALEELYRTDDDPAVRRAAQQAGRHIYRQQQR